jgi:hypothetical protein
MANEQLVKRLNDRINQPGRLDAAEAARDDDDYLQLLNGFIRPSPAGLIVNPSAAQLLSPPEVATVERIRKGLAEAIEQGKAALSRGETGDLVPVLGAAGSPDMALLKRRSGYVKVKTYWYGFKVYLSHACVTDVTKAGAGVAVILAASGVALWIGGLIAAIVGAVAGFDKGNGVTVSFVWPSVLVWIRSGKNL